MRLCSDNASSTVNSDLYWQDCHGYPRMNIAIGYIDGKRPDLSVYQLNDPMRCAYMVLCMMETNETQ